jgi:hypothetical protein
MKIIIKKTSFYISGYLLELHRESDGVLYLISKIDDYKTPTLN